MLARFLPGEPDAMLVPGHHRRRPATVALGAGGPGAG
jgi:hypothetical protein